MTLRESLIIYCNEHEQCMDCPLGAVCDKFHDEEDPYETMADRDDDSIKVIAYDARKTAEKILFHLNLCEENSNPGQP